MLAILRFFINNIPDEVTLSSFEQIIFDQLRMVHLFHTLLLEKSCNSFEMVDVEVLVRVAIGKCGLIFALDLGDEGLFQRLRQLVASFHFLLIFSN